MATGEKQTELFEGEISRISGETRNSLAALIYLLMRRARDHAT